METSNIFGLFCLVACVCVVASVPSKDRREELAHLANILGKIRTLERVRQDAKSSAWESSPGVEEDDAASVVAKDAMPRRSSGFAKRQGDWSYDYGLGGGRFGKRANYGDYGIGGGRFGRDVDHVDPQSDANDGIN